MKELNCVENIVISVIGLAVLYLGARWAGAKALDGFFRILGEASVIKISEDAQRTRQEQGAIKQ